MSSTLAWRSTRIVSGTTLCMVLTLYVASREYAPELAAQPPGVFFPAVRELSAVVRNPSASDATVMRAMGALGRLGPEGVPGAQAILERVDVCYRGVEFVDERAFTGIPSSGVIALSEMGPSVVPTLIAALRKGTSLVQIVAIRALGEIGPSAHEAIPVLADLFVADVSDPKSAFEVSLEAGLTLAKLGPGSIPVLSRFSEYARVDIRRAAIEALGTYVREPESVLPTLLHALGDREASIRQHAIKAIGGLKTASPQVMAALAEIARSDPDKETRSVADSTLRMLQRQR